MDHWSENFFWITLHQRNRRIHSLREMILRFLWWTVIETIFLGSIIRCRIFPKNIPWNHLAWISLQGTWKSWLSLIILRVANFFLSNHEMWCKETEIELVEVRANKICLFMATTERYISLTSSPWTTTKKIYPFMATIKRLVHFTDPQSMDYHKENLSFYGNDREIGRASCRERV